MCRRTVIRHKLGQYDSGDRFRAGANDGAYYRYAQRYAAILARSGIALRVIETSGSVDNLMRLLAS